MALARSLVMSPGAEYDVMNSQPELRNTGTCYEFAAAMIFKRNTKSRNMTYIPNLANTEIRWLFFSHHQNQTLNTKARVAHNKTLNYERFHQ